MAPFTGVKRKPLSFTSGGSTWIPIFWTSATSTGSLSVLPISDDSSGRHELDRMVRLQVGRLEGHDAVGGRVRLVESVARELLDFVENGARLRRVARFLLHAALDEGLALPGHLLGFLLAHGAAQDVALPQGEAREDAGGLLHLLLIDHDAVGLLQDRLQQRMGIDNRLAPVLAGDEGRNHFHRPGPIEGDQGDEVLDFVDLQLPQQIPHASRLPPGTRRRCRRARASRRSSDRPAADRPGRSRSPPSASRSRTPPAPRSAS